MNIMHTVRKNEEKSVIGSGGVSVQGVPCGVTDMLIESHPGETRCVGFCAGMLVHTWVVHADA